MVKGAAFHARFSVEWVATGRDHQTRDQIRQCLQNWALPQALKLNVTSASNLQINLNAGLSKKATLAEATLVSGSVTVSVAEETQKIGREFDRLCHLQAVERQRRRNELEELHYRRDEIYSRPDVWRGLWLKDHPEAFDDMLDDRFERMAIKFRQANDLDSAASAQLLIAGLLADFLRALSDDERTYLLSQLGRVFSSYGRTDLADRLPPTVS